MAEGAGRDATPLALNGRQLPVSSTELETLQAEVNRIKQKLPSLPNWLAATGAICGVLAALFSIASGVWNAHVYLSSSPKLSLIDGPTLEFAYLPQQYKVMFTLHFSLANDGSQPNVVTDLSARVINRIDVSQRVVAFTST